MGGPFRPLKEDIYIDHDIKIKNDIQHLNQTLAIVEIFLFQVHYILLKPEIQCYSRHGKPDP